jgi:hypothetical protein
VRGIVAALAAFALLGWQAVSTIGRQVANDANEYLLNAQYLDAHHWLPPQYVSYEYSSPPLYEAITVGLEHAIRAIPSWPLELTWNLATRLLWLVLLGGSVAALGSESRRFRRFGAVALALLLAWGLDEAISLGKSERWSAGQLLALAAALGLVCASALIAREIWPDRPLRAVSVAGFVMAYPVVLRLGSLFHPETLAAFLSAIIRTTRRKSVLTTTLVASPASR